MMGRLSQCGLRMGEVVLLVLACFWSLSLQVWGPCLPCSVCGIGLMALPRPLSAALCLAQPPVTPPPLPFDLQSD